MRKFRILVVAAFLCLHSAFAGAQETSANFGLGGSIKVGSDPTCNSTNIGALRYGCGIELCDGANWINASGGTGANDAGGTPNVSADFSAGSVIIGNDSTVCNGTHTGVIRYSSQSGLQYCNGSSWDGLASIPTDPCACSPSPGDVCADGSVYAGLSPDGDVPMFTTPADAGQFSWNDGSSNWLDIPTLPNCPGFYADCATGEANTALLVGLGTGPSPAPYVAARHCDSLIAHGKDDWYLPAASELQVLYTNRIAIGGFNLSGPYPNDWYRSSSERDFNGALVLIFSTGSTSDNKANSGMSVRCVRK